MTSAAPRAIPPKAALAFAVVAVSTGALFVRLAEAPPLAVAFGRCSIATAILAAIGWRACRDEWRRLDRREVAIAAGTGVALALHFAAWISSLSYTSVASSLVLVNTTSLWVALLSPFLSSDRVRPGTWVGLAVSLAGCVVIGYGDMRASGEGLDLSGRAVLGDLLAIAGAVTCALYLLAGRRLRAKLSLVPYVTACYGFAALALLAMVLATGTSLMGYSTETYGWLVALAIVPQILGHSSYNYALRYVSAALTSVVALGECVGATVLAWLCLGEVPSSWTLAGGAVVLAGVLVALRAER